METGEPTRKINNASIKAWGFDDITDISIYLATDIGCFVLKTTNNEFMVEVDDKIETYNVNDNIAFTKPSNINENIICKSIPVSNIVPVIEKKTRPYRFIGQQTLRQQMERLNCTKKGYFIQIASETSIFRTDGIIMKYEKGSWFRIERKKEQNITNIKYTPNKPVSNDGCDELPILNCLEVNNNLFVVKQNQVIRYVKDESDKTNRRLLTRNVINTFDNNNGLVTHAENSETLITLGPKIGEVSIVEYNSKDNMKDDKLLQIEPHTSNIQKITISSDNNRIATCSTNGTVIKIFNRDEDRYVLNRELRRGTCTSNINDIAFSQNGNYLACCSGNGTLHIFDITTQPNTTVTMMGYLTCMILPSSESDYAVTKHKLDENFDISQYKTVCKFGKDGTLHVFTTNGQYCKVYGEKYTQIEKINILGLLV